MASSSSSPHQEYYTGKWEYDVFVCFRGKDTRRLFTSHLAGHLRQRSIRHFTDEVFDRTENIDAGLLELLRRSAMSVVIFSEGFAESSYCLDEVATVAQSVERFGHRVLPVFYGVRPEEVAGGEYRDVIEAELKPSMEKKKRWIDGLNQVTHGGVNELVKELYSTLLSENNKLSLQDLELDHRRERLSRLRVVVVLDNVETPQQLEQLLLGETWDPTTKLFGPGSVIIITSRNKRVLQYVRAKVHCVLGLSPVESLQLFNLHAFRKPSGPSDEQLKGHSHLAVWYCKGNPLALKVLGGALFGKEKEYWKSFLSGLERNSKPEIHDILSTSYYALKGEEQRLFMDVACFHFITPRTRLVEYLATSYKSGYSLIEDLIDKSLMFTIHSNDVMHNEMVLVHDLLREMAWNIVKEEPLPSRLRNPSDVRRLFAIREARKDNLKLFKAFGGGKAIQSLALNLSKTKNNEVCLGAKAFEGMDSLRLLGFYGHKAAELVGVPEIRLVDGRLDTLPNELRWLEWTGYPLKCLPRKFCPEKLVTLSLRHSRVKRCWPKGVEPKLVHLVTLDLSYSAILKFVPNLSWSKKLELLRLKGCKSLVELPAHVQYLDKLVEVDLCECSNLVRVPARLNSECLKYVRLAGCPKLTHWPEINSSEMVFEVLPIGKLPMVVHKVKMHGKFITTLKRFRLCHSTINNITKKEEELDDDDDDDDDDAMSHMTIRN
ncbi:Disease resistance-like protein DSC1 [Linum grandiflorum]